MRELDSKTDYNNNKKLYQFLATSYDIKSLAAKIATPQKCQMSYFNLKKIVSESKIA